MPRFELTTRVGAPPEATFDLLRPVRFPEWRSAIEEVAPVDGPLDRPGAQFVTHYRSRLMPGSRHEATAIDPPRLLGLRGEAEGARYRARRSGSTTLARRRSSGSSSSTRRVGPLGRLLRRRIRAGLERESRISSD